MMAMTTSNSIKVKPRFLIMNLQSNHFRARCPPAPIGFSRADFLKRKSAD
jgi:hypothetical protein